MQNRMRTRDEIEQVLRKNDLAYHRLDTDEGGWAILIPELGAKVLAAGVEEEVGLWSDLPNSNKKHKPGRALSIVFR